MHPDRDARQSPGTHPVRPTRAARGAARISIGRRLRRRRTVTIVGLVLTLTGAGFISAKAIAPPPPRLVAHRVLLGAAIDDRLPAASSGQLAVPRLEAAIGSSFAIGHSSVPWGKALGGLPAWTVTQGRVPLISFGDGANPRAVAAGRYDSYLTALARSVRALGRPVMLSYAVGRGGSARSGRRGSGPAFVAAWRHVHDLFAGQSVAAAWVWSPTADRFRGAAGGVDPYWPGDRYVDWIGAVATRGNSCGDGSGGRDLGTVLGPFYAWASTRGKPLLVSQVGTIEDPGDPGHKAAWYADTARTLATSMPRVRAVVFRLDRRGRCDWRPDSSERSMVGFTRLARELTSGGRGDPPALVPGTTGLATTTVAPATVAPTTVPPTTAAAPTTQPPAAAPPSASACAGGGGVSIGPGDDAQQVVNAHRAGTTYIIRSGTHLRNFSVQPRSGDTFCGEPGAVLDGGRSLRSAFSGQGTNVTLDAVTVQNYAPARLGGAIEPDRHASGWVLRNVSSLHNGWAGLLLADGMRILGGHYNDNDQEGIGGNVATGILLDGLDGDPATIDGPELARNHALHASCDWDGGGMKWDFGQITIRNAYVHDNDCKGLWADINVHDALIERNLVEDNGHEGIFYEISSRAVIRDNQVYRNGLRGNGWYWAGGITVASSSAVEIYGNHLSGNYNGITGTQQDRSSETVAAYLLDHLNVHDNLICATAGPHPVGVAAGNGANLAVRDIAFRGNTVQTGACR